MADMQIIATDNPYQLTREEFDPPAWITPFFPAGEDRLKGDGNWLPWSLAMKRLFRAAKVWDIVSGEELRPPANGGDDLQNWIAKDLYAKIHIFGSVESHVLALHLGNMSSYKMWMRLQCLYQQKGTTSIVFWIRQLFRTLNSTSTMTQHVDSFQTTLLYLEHAGFKFDEPAKAGILLATLMNDKTGPDSWSSFVLNFPFDNSTQMLTLIASIFDEVRRRKAVDYTPVRAKARKRR